MNGNSLVMYFECTSLPQAATCTDVGLDRDHPSSNFSLFVASTHQFPSIVEAFGIPGKPPKQSFQVLLQWTQTSKRNV